MTYLIELNYQEENKNCNQNWYVFHSLTNKVIISGNVIAHPEI